MKYNQYLGASMQGMDTELKIKLCNMSLKEPSFHAVYYIGTMPRFIRAKTWFFGIILCSLNNIQGLMEVAN